MKYTIIALLLTALAYQNAYSQKIKVTYLDSAYAKTDEANAKYYRIIEAHPDGSKKVIAKTYFLDGDIESSTTFLDKSLKIMHSSYTSYFKNGNLKEEGNYHRGKKDGTWKGWFANGQLKERGEYFMGFKAQKWEYWYKDGQPKEVSFYSGDPKKASHKRQELIHYWKENNEQVVLDGNGNVTYYHDDTQIVSSHGEYKNGFKHGIWKGYDEEGELLYEEVYSNDKVSGTSWNKEGKKFKYTSLETQAVPKGGMTSFYKYIAAYLDYPKEARLKGIKGKVFVQFVVDKSGQLTQVKSIKGIGAGCDEEAVRVIKKHPKWSPATYRGQNVDGDFQILPITFSFR